MHPSTIILALASAALIHAVAIPQPAPPTTYDTCLDQYAQILGPEIADGTAPAAGIAQCTGCAAQAVTAGFLVYDPSDVQPAKDEYTAKMEECRGTTSDDQYNTCINEYGQIFELEPSADIAQCTGCAAEAVSQAFIVYLEQDTEAAKERYNVVMDYCRDTN